MHRAGATSFIVGQKTTFLTQLFRADFGRHGGGGDDMAKTRLSPFFQPVNSPTHSLDTK